MTSNEIAIRDHAEVDSWAQVMPDVVKLSQHLEDTEFVPKTLRGRPAAIAAAILAGREAGIGPMRALSHMHIVDGRPSMSAEQKRAQALAAGHHIVYVESTTTRCTVKGRRRDEDQWSTVTWTMDDAKAAKLDGKDNWRKWPRRMLQARATGELCDMLFPDATAGLATTEELVDDSDAVGIQSNGEAPKKRTARRQTTVTERVYPSVTEPETTAKEAHPQPPLPGEEGYEEPAKDNRIYRQTEEARREEAEAGAASAGITDAQLTKLHTVFSQLDWTDRDDRLRAASVIVGRQLSSSKDLSKAEAVTLINTLEICAHKPDPQQALTDLLAAVQREEADVAASELVQETFDAEIVEEGE